MIVSRRGKREAWMWSEQGAGRGGTRTPRMRNTAPRRSTPRTKTPSPGPPSPPSPSPSRPSLSEAADHSQSGFLPTIVESKLREFAGGSERSSLWHMVRLVYPQQGRQDQRECPGPTVPKFLELADFDFRARFCKAADVTIKTEKGRVLDCTTKNEKGGK